MHRSIAPPKVGLIIVASLGLACAVGCGPSKRPPAPKPTCSDNVKNGAETDVDCGGGCAACADGLGCAAAADCESGVCTGNVCQAPSCSDTVKNGTETDVDCGGGCAACADGLGCAAAADCESGVCTGNVCQAPSCSDTVKNGTETDVDCGGGVCPGCADGLACVAPTDCANGVCTGNVCQPCAAPTDCASGVCTAGVCQAPTCADGVQNGTESDIDCGGDTCAGCENGKACAADTDCQSGSCVAGLCLPPDPTLVAPPLDRTVATDFEVATSFLYSGSNPVQTGVAPGIIDASRVAIVKGRVLDRSGAPIAGVRITALGHPELGRTYTRADGAFDLAVNGGGRVTVMYTKSGRLQVARQVDAPWRDYVWMPDVVMIALDPKVTTVQLAGATDMLVAQGSPVTDADGTRQATVLFPAGTQAVMDAGGSTQPLDTLSIRATEYTVGPTGEEAMPGSLPPASAYTYAVELSADEALAAGATAVHFNQPIITYVDDFLGFAVGGDVPVGYYDRQAGVWVPSANGRVIGILSVTSGMADLDVDGSGSPASAAALAALGITDTERQKLATLYTPGATLWRVAFDHLTPWDCNWPWAPPIGATPPPGPPADPTPPEDPCKKAGSIIGCQDQTLLERLPIVGTPYALRYTSARAPGHVGNFKLDIPVTGASVPAPLAGVTLEVDVAGEKTVQTFPPTPNQSYTFVWDGKDGFGRRVQGRQQAVIRLGYRYQMVYATGAAWLAGFGAVGGTATTDPTRRKITSWTSWARWMGGLGEQGRGLGGWSIDVNHLYAPSENALYLGTGGRRSPSEEVLVTVAGSGTGAYYGDGGRATSAGLNSPHAVAVAPDGTIYISDTGNNRIRRVGTDGIISTVAGTGVAGYTGDGGPGSAAEINTPYYLAVGPDGTVFFADLANNCVRKIALDGTISTVAGNGVPGFSGDDGPATAAQLYYPAGVALGPDGSLFIGDMYNNRIRRVGPDGIITTVAGTGAAGYSGDGGPALAAKLRHPSGIAVGPDGSIYLADTTNLLIRRVGPSGIISTVAGSGVSGFSGDGGLATLADFALNLPGVALGPDGSLYIPDGNNYRVRRVDTDGVITTVAGDGTLGSGGEAGPATKAQLNGPLGTAVGPGGCLYIADTYNHRIRKMCDATPRTSSGDRLIPSDDTSELYVFDGSGRHVETLDAATGLVRYQFGYDGSGRLATITDGSGNVTAIQRDTAGLPTAIVAPGGQTTTLGLDADGLLASVTSPSGATTGLVASPDGLLTSLIDPAGGTHTISYDADGLLGEDQDPAGGSSALTHTPVSAGSETVTVATALGRVSSFTFGPTAAGGMTRTTTSPTGAQTLISIGADGSQTLTEPDGTVVVSTVAPDPRFGMDAPIPASITVTTPLGLASTVTTSVSTALSNPADPLSLTSYTETMTENGQSRTRSYDATAQTMTESTAAGRQTVRTLDAGGHVVSLQSDPSLAVASFTYDGAGRMTQASQGGQSATYGYDAAGWLVSRTDALGAVTTYGRDADGHLTSVTLPSGRVFTFGYDANGNRTQVVMPGGAIHGLSYTVTDLPAGYTPPVGGAYSESYDLDGSLVQATLPSGRTVTTAYDAGGRTTSITSADASDTFTYADATDRVAGITRTPVAGGAAAVLWFSYDGALVRSASFSGPATGSFYYTYDTSFRLVGVQLDTNPQVSIGRDADGLVTGYGPFAFTRNGPARTTSQISDGTFVESISHDSLGRLGSRAATVSGTPIYGAQLAFDGAGRISGKTETVAGTSHVYAYSYDLDGQLTQVTIDGAVAESFSYDADGNRTSHTVGAGSPELATFDTTDQLVQRGSVAYAYDADGYLSQRGGDSFVYGTRGELLSFTSSSGATVTYRYDGMGRRVARTDAAGTTQYLYGSLSDPFQLTHERDASGVLTAFYYDEAGRLLAFDRGGTWYYAGTDQMGSPRVVVDSTGTVVRSIDYDAFGSVLTDSAPAFDLPIGFGGGLIDTASGLVRFGMRDYDPASGRWSARDPLLFDGAEANLYLYAGNDPVAMRDPSGLASVGASFCAGACAGGKISITDKGMSFCVELGAGLGESMSVDPLGGLDSDGVSLSASAKVKAGELEASLKGALALSACGLSERANVGVRAGPLGLGTNLLDGETETEMETRRGRSVGSKGKLKIKTSVGESAQVKVSARVCKRIDF